MIGEIVLALVAVLCVAVLVAVVVLPVGRIDA